eukprot:15425597-Alexandrium_andersonii.AAC.1
MSLLAEPPSTPVIPCSGAPSFPKAMLASCLVISEGDDEGAARPGHTVGGPLHPPTTHQKVPASQRAPASLAD